MRALIALLLVGACANASPAQEQSSHQFGWLKGCWELEDGSIREHWSTPEGGYMFGHAVTYREGIAVFFEQLRVDPGTPPVLNAYPAGNGPSPFPATEITATSVVFENTAHDYPQRITYQRDRDQLRATISLIDGANERVFNYQTCSSSN